MKYIKKIRLAGLGYNIKRVIYNYIRIPIFNIYSNIKYICSNNINDNMIDINTELNEYNYLHDNVNDLENREYLESYDVEEIIESYLDNGDYITHDYLDDINEDIKEIKKNINDNNDNVNDNVDSLIERDLLINEVIKTIINRLDNNDNV